MFIPPFIFNVPSYDVPFYRKRLTTLNKKEQLKRKKKNKMQKQSRHRNK